MSCLRQFYKIEHLPACASWVITSACSNRKVNSGVKWGKDSWVVLLGSWIKNRWNWALSIQRRVREWKQWEVRIKTIILSSVILSSFAPKIISLHRNPVNTKITIKWKDFLQFLLDYLLIRLRLKKMNPISKWSRSLKRVKRQSHQNLISKEWCCNKDHK
jgi:hypothetical protein